MCTAERQSDVVTFDLGAVLAADDLIGVLTREVRVRLVNISASGCMVESAQRLDPGTTGILRLTVGGETYADDVRVVRLQQVHGAGAAWQMGAEFLWTSQPGTRSLRRMATRLRQGAVQDAAVQFEFVGRRM